MKMPLKLERLVNGLYKGNVAGLVKDTQAYAEKLRELHQEVYDKFDRLPRVYDPREHLHSLEKYWSPERVERLEEIGNALLDSNKEKKLLALAQKSIVYKYDGDIYAIPFSVRLSEASSAANGGFIARALSMVIPSLIRFSAPITALGALCGYAMAKRNDQEKNPFEELGKKLEDSAKVWLALQNSDKLHQEVQEVLRTPKSPSDRHSHQEDESYEDALRRLKENPGGRE